MSNRSLQSGKKAFWKTFTYFIPAPPHRKTGYREIEFDKIMQGILSTGFEIENIEAQSAGGESGGLFIVALLKTKSKKIFESDINQDIQHRFKLTDTHSSPDIVLDEEEDV